MVQYDKAVIIKFAERLYSQANSIVVLCGILGIIVGGVAGFGAQAGAREPNWLVAIFAVVLCGAIGVVIGQARAFSLRLQAQVALCQVQIEENTAAAVSRPQVRSA